MRIVHSINTALLDFIETTRVGSTAFRWLRILIFGFGIFVVTRKAAGQFLSFDFSDVLFMFMTSLTFLVIYWRWEIGIVLILCTTSFIFYYDYLPTLSLYHFIPEIRILEPLRLQIGQGVMLFLLLLYGASAEARTVRQRLATPLTPAVFVFLVVILAATISGVVFSGVALGQAVENGRMFSYYLMFFVTVLCIKSRRELRFLRVAFFMMAMTVAVLMCIQFVAGEHFKVFLGGNVRVESFGSYAGRILPPGSDLIWMALPFVIARIATASPKLRRVLVPSLGLLTSGLLLTFTRTVWMSTLVSIGLMAVLSRGEIRRGIMRMFATVSIYVFVLLMVLGLFSTAEESYVTPYIKRFTSIFHPETYGETTSAGERLIEIRAAWPLIADRPWLGNGVGAVYRWVESWDDAAQSHYMRAVTYMHNAYVLLLTDAGVLGLATCMLMYVIFFVRARVVYRLLSDPDDKGIVLACGASVVSIMIGAVMQPTFAASHDTPMVGIMFGMVELLRYFRSQETQGVPTPAFAALDKKS